MPRRYPLERMRLQLLTCVSITLCHSFGMGSGVGSALLRGSAVLLPAAGVIYTRAHTGAWMEVTPSDPKQKAEVISSVLEEEGATLLFADTHIVKHLAPPSVELACKLRGGIVKIGSGTDIFDDGSGMVYEGAPLLAMGKKK